MFEYFFSSVLLSKIKSILINQFHVLNASSRLSFNLFVSFDSISLKSLTINLSTIMSKSYNLFESISISSFTVCKNPFKVNLINQLFNTSFFIDSFVSQFFSLRI